MEKVLLNSDEDYFDYCVMNGIGNVHRIYASDYYDVDDDSGLDCDFWCGSLNIRSKPKEYPCVFVWRCWCDSDHDYYYGEFIYPEDFKKNVEEL